MTQSDSKAIARQQVAELVTRFQRNETDYFRPSYNETQARTDFITPLLEALGWDVQNRNQRPGAFRDVIEEATVDVGPEKSSKKPDYELRRANQRTLFVEAKKPSVRIDRARSPSFQIRRYGYSASLAVSVLTNFRQLAVYDCVPRPDEADEAHVARLTLINYDEFDNRFDELWEVLSRDEVYSGEFDRRYSIGITRRGANQFDDYFLTQVRSWRERLAVDIHSNTPGLTPTELSYVVHLFLSRIIFLRICEDRDIEKYESLKRLDSDRTFNAFMEKLERADDLYDSGLFRLLDHAALGIKISDSTLQGIFTELYYPQSPYTFAVIESGVLGEIYEQFLGEEIHIRGDRIEIVSKPEVREGGGVVPTPGYIADAIVERTLRPIFSQKGPHQIADMTVADICCGSGTFLVSVYTFLMNHYLEWYLANDPADHDGRTIFEASLRNWRLTFQEKRRILTTHIRGVDLDPNAVEVARFSLLLKLIEGESETALRNYVDDDRIPVLPSLDETIRAGNSLVSQPEWTSSRGTLSSDLSERVNPLTWSVSFAEEFRRGGFDAIVGNPPYIRIQNMTVYSPEETEYYRSTSSPYSTASQDNFDKYALFIERALTLLQPGGRLGVIVPHKFMTIQSGEALRHILSVDKLLAEIVHFGVKQVFGPGTSNYTCILILDLAGSTTVQFEQASPLEDWRYGILGVSNDISTTLLTDEPWEFADAETRMLFTRIRNASSMSLGQSAEIFVGLQTSADSIYIFEPTSMTSTTATLRWDGKEWPIERDITRSCLQDVTIEAFKPPSPNSQMIFPYRLDTTGTRTKAHLIQPIEMASRFPGCWAYLSARRVELEQRDIVGGIAAEKQWYQFGRSQSLVKFDTPKIILPILSLEPRYTYDETDIVATGGGNGPYYMIRSKDEDEAPDEFLLAVLDHPLMEAFIRTKTSAFRGGYYSHGKQFIEDLPLPVVSATERDKIVAIVRSLIDTHQQLADSRTPHDADRLLRRTKALRQQIEDLVTAAFGLDLPAMELVRAVPVPA